MFNFTLKLYVYLNLSTMSLKEEVFFQDNTKPAVVKKVESD